MVLLSFKTVVTPIIMTIVIIIVIVVIKIYYTCGCTLNKELEKTTKVLIIIS